MKKKFYDIIQNGRQKEMKKPLIEFFFNSQNCLPKNKIQLIITAKEIKGIESPNYINKIITNQCIFKLHKKMIFRRLCRRKRTIMPVFQRNSLP